MLVGRRAATAALLALSTTGPPSLQSYRDATGSYFSDESVLVGVVEVNKVGPDGRLVLSATRTPTVDVVTSPPKVTSRCFLDISIGGSSVGRIVVDLFGELCPRASEVFRALCTGEDGVSYAGTTVYKVLSDLTMQAGTIDGFPTFEHDNYAIKHNVAGLVSMVNSGNGGNSRLSDSRFLIQFPEDAGFLDGRYEAFGRVSEGMDVVREIGRVRVTGTKNVPAEKVIIERAGVMQGRNSVGCTAC